MELYESNDLERNGNESDDDVSEYDCNSDVEEDQDGEVEFSMSDMEVGQRNISKQKLNPLPNKGKRKLVSLTGSQQHRKSKIKSANIREAEMEVMSDMSKFMKLKL